jgi:hypothetical protein
VSIIPKEVKPAFARPKRGKAFVHYPIRKSLPPPYYKKKHHNKNKVNSCALYVLVAVFFVIALMFILI